MPGAVRRFERSAEAAHVAVSPVHRLRGSFRPPGDKSISHRAVMLAALADGPCRITALCDGADVQSTVGCIEALGVPVRRIDSGLEIEGVGIGGLRPPERALDAGNSGTTMRLLAGILAGQRFDSILHGDESLRRRPMQRIIAPLRRMGAEIHARENNYAPLEISGRPLRGAVHELTVASAQVKSCILLAGLHAQGDTVVVEPAPTRDHTEIMLEAMGVPLHRAGRSIRLQPAQPRAVDFPIPGDPSAAAFFLCAALLMPDSRVEAVGVGVNPTRARYLEILQQAGARIELRNLRQVNGEPVADITAEFSELQPLDIHGRDVPLCIDEIPILAVAATQAHGRTRIYDAAELRVKESDRLQLLAENLRRMGARVEEFPDGLNIDGPCRLRGAEIETAGDHRMVMAFAVAALIAEGTTRIGRPDAADISYPGFFRTLAQLAEAGEHE